MTVDPRLADRIRKIAAFGLAALGTWLFFGVLFRLARGQGRLDDPALWGFLALVALAVAWVRAARRVRRSPSAVSSGPMGEIVIAVYRPKEGKEDELRALVEKHMPALRRRGLVTDRPPILCRSREDGTWVEIFEWKDADAARKAHADPEVGPIWNAMSEVAELPPLADLRESTKRFPHFDPVEL